MSGDLPSFDPDKPDRQLDRICQNKGVQFRAGKSFLDATCYKINDCHWNEKGHRKVHQALQSLAGEPRGRYTGSNAKAMAGALAEA
jgi:hypothetical protein